MTFAVLCVVMLNVPSAPLDTTPRGFAPESRITVTAAPATCCPRESQMVPV
jgi:hypothetical protein